MTTKLRVFAGLWLVTLTTVGSTGRAEELVLTREGKPLAVIVTADEPTTVAAFAAGELQYHVQRITGAVLPIVSEGTRTTGHRILVGKNRISDEVLGRTETFKNQEYLIRFLPNDLMLLGTETTDSEASSWLPKRVAGRFDLALEFDGKSKQVTLPECDFNDEEGTMEAWVWLPAAKPRTHGTILRLDSGNPWTYHILQRDMNSSRISYTTYDGKQGHGVACGELADGWHHVLGTHDARTGKMELFVDGIRIGADTYVKTACKGAALGIGGPVAEPGAILGNPFEGRIDEVRISTVVRPIKEAVGGPYPPDEHTTVLLHCDEKGGPARNVVARLSSVPPPAFFGENGTLYAVYDFLERCCEVRWYAPGTLGLVCPKTPTLVVRGTDVRRAPAMFHRWIAPSPLYLPGPPEQVPEREVQLWKLRMRIGGKNFSVSHSFYGYYDRFSKSHPDWFAQGYTGQSPQMCYTHPGFIQQVAQDARDYFDGKGSKPGATAAGDVFGLVPMDNMSWCKCPDCQAELNKAEEKNQQFNNGKASDYVFGFVNKVAREVRKSHPTKRIGALAYSDYAYYPVKEAVEPNVVVQLCLHTRNWWCPSMEANDRRVLREWRERDPNRPLYLWLYYCFPALNARSVGFHYFPGYFAHTVVPQMKLFHDAKIEGIFMEHSGEFGESYLMDQLEFYVTLKLADDPGLDGNRLIDEFFERYYGAAARPMKAMYSLIEETFSSPKSYPPEIQRSPAHQHQTKELAWKWLATKEWMDRLAAMMAEARQAATTSEEKDRVAMFERGQWNYLRAGQKSEGKAESAR